MLVLGKVIEVVTKKDYFTNAQERIFDRVGMKNSGFFEMDGVNRKLAVGYLKANGTLRNNLFEHVVKGGPAGGGWSTAEDILAYSEALRGGKLVKRETFELMRTPKPELSSPNYGYGFVLFEGADVWGHGGDFPGIDFDWNGYGDSGYTLVILANYDGVNDPIKRKVTRMVRAAR
jgi:CubicO group peptidase (beta-lactamase class C family)